MLLERGDSLSVLEQCVLRQTGAEDQEGMLTGKSLVGVIVTLAQL